MIDVRTIAARGAALAFAATNAPAAVTIRRSILGAYSIGTGKHAPGTDAEYTCAGIVAGYSLHDIDGTNILATDRRVTLLQSQVAAAGRITTADTVLIDGKPHSIVNVGCDPVGVTWVLQVRA